MISVLGAQSREVDRLARRARLIDLRKRRLADAFVRWKQDKVGSASTLALAFSLGLLLGRPGRRDDPDNDRGLGFWPAMTNAMLVGWRIFSSDVPGGQTAMSAMRGDQRDER